MVKKKEQVTKITVRQYGSSIRRDGRQKEYLKSLGLGKINSKRELIDTPAVRGLLDKLTHMVEIVS